jgi:Leucine-rich repeat (LRR) protein
LIPKSIGKLANFVRLDLYLTRLSVPIPTSLRNLAQLNTLIAHNANLEGPIPASLGKLGNLYLLDLSANYQLNGCIPMEIFLPSFSSGLNLSYNSLSGSLPSHVGNLVNLNQLNLSKNQLSQ